MIEHLFVYGTLRRDAAHPMHAPLHAAGRLLGDARLRGRLYDLGRYPGVVLDRDAPWVHGEVYALDDPSVLSVLDAYEGAGPNDPEPREYERVATSVVLHGGEPMTVWIYEYRWSVEAATPIASGDYLARTRESGAS